MSEQSTTLHLSISFGSASVESGKKTTVTVKATSNHVGSVKGRLHVPDHRGRVSEHGEFDLTLTADPQSQFFFGTTVIEPVLNSSETRSYVVEGHGYHIESDVYDSARDAIIIVVK
jgi:hypothetical protein